MPQIECKCQHRLHEQFILPELESLDKLGSAGHPVVEGRHPLSEHGSLDSGGDLEGYFRDSLFFILLYKSEHLQY